MQRIQLVLGISILVVALISQIIATALYQTLVRDLNDASGPEEWINPTSVRIVEVLNRHRALFPDSPRRRRMWLISIPASALFFVGFFMTLFAFK